MTRPISRRTLGRTLGGALGVALLSAGCGGEEEAPPSSDVVQPLATPLAAVPGFDEPRRWAGRTLRVGLWGGEIQRAIAATVLDPFSTLTGAVVTVFQASYDRLAASVADGDGYLDLIVADLTRVDGLLSAGVTQPLTAGLVDPARLGAVAVLPGGMPFYAYAMVGAVRRDLAPPEELPGDWAAWGDLSRYPSPRSLPGSPLGTLEIALLAGGAARGELYPLDVERALAALDAYVPSVGDRWWRSGDEAVVWLIQEEVSLAATWHHRVIAAQLDGRPIEVVWRDALTAVDYLAVADGSPNADMAEDLIRFALADEVQSTLGYAAQLGPVAPGAYRHIAPVQARRLPTYPDRGAEPIAIDHAWWGANREATGARFAEWLTTRGVTTP